MVTGTAHRRRHQINLQALHAECETNYLRLQKILHNLPADNTRNISLLSADGAERRFQFLVLERARYTASLEIVEMGLRSRWGLSASFSVRMYHDARMAEVLAFQQEKQVEPFIHYPNSRMLQTDEKFQWNFLLGEWLTYCLTYGYNTGKSFIPQQEAVSDLSL